MLMEASPTRSAYDALSQALAAQRCVLLDGRAAIARTDALEAHRRYLRAGCDVVTTSTRGLLSAPASDAGGGSAHWMDGARQGVRLARRAIAELGREGQVAVAFTIDPEIDGPNGEETVRLLSRALADDPPDLLHLEGLSVVRPSLYATIEALLSVGLPLWLSFRRCRDGLCGVYGQHWGGPEGDGFGRAVSRFEELGVGALVIGCVPPDHVHGMVSYLRDFTDMPLGVAPNLGYLTSDGWQAGEDDDALPRMALRWREEGAELIGGCCGVEPEHVAAMRASLEGTRPGPRRDAPEEVRRVGMAAPARWRDEAGRSLYPLAFPDLITKGDVFLPTQGSFLIWRHLFQEGVGRGRCLDIGCGNGLQSVQLALNGAEHVHAIDIDPDAAEATLVNAFRNGVGDRISAATTDLYEWVPDRRYDVIVASLFQAPIDPLNPGHPDRPADFWGRTAVDHVLGLLPHALADDGVAYVLQISILSQQRTDEVLELHGLRARVADFGFYPITDSFRRVADQIARIERISDAHHLEISGMDIYVAYLLEITRA